ncbi:helical backbone metal receptor [Polaribacter sp. PL03]|uniref:ABC transporter substrate-binding protein n=1 Tax=Polaribacter sp. PL03 TaxID=3088353 RepID=UPI0029D13C41|nr:helical backbone metal receptor [Polaribacter sp. PL03]MDX6747608.1 helical backbone metal receptor [Polaribacter sp. PL03]
MIQKLRIICLVPSLTELLVDLGLEENIVGVTKFCVHPENLKKDKVIVGGTKNINLEKIKALKPDFILCNKEENTKEIVENCSVIATTHVSDLFTIEDVIDLIKYYATIFHCKKKATIIIDELRNTIKKFKLYIKDKSTLKVVYFIWKKPWMIAANNTFINHLLELNKFENCFKNQNRYPEIILEDLELKQVDAILLSSEPYPFKENDFSDFNNYTENIKVVLVDGEYFSWYGSRLLNAFEYFKELREKL